MTTTDFMKFFDPELTKALSGFSSPAFDIQAVMNTQRKNFQALTEVQQRSMEGFQALMQRQSEILSQIVQDNVSLASELMNEGTPEQKVARQADIMKKVYEKTMRNMQEVSEMLSSSNQSAAEILNKRVSASLNEIKAAVENSKPASKKAA